MASRPLFAVAGALILALGAPSVARAQTAMPTFPTIPTRTLPDGSPGQTRGQGNNPTGINFTDCDSDTAITFHVLIPGTLPAGGVQVWASPSSDCTDSAQRQKTTGTCNALTEFRSPLLAAFDVTLYARDIVWAAFQTQTSQVTYDPSLKKDVSACHLQTVSAGSTVNLYFLFSSDQTGSTQVATMQPYPMLTDTLGPTAPSAVSLGIGSSLLKVNWALNGPPDNDLSGFKVFMDPPQGKEGQDAGGFDASCITVGASPGDASTVDDSGATTMARVLAPFDDAGTDGGIDGGDDGGDGGVDSGVSTPDAAMSVDSGSTSSASCGTPNPALFADCDEGGSSLFQNGMNGSEIPDTYKVGTVANIGTELPVSGLQNGVQYTFAVAGYDVSLNTGPITVIGCEYPSAINDFWGEYRGAGGQAGGSFCNVEGAGVPVSLSIFAMTVFGVAGAFTRRRRK